MNICLFKAFIVAAILSVGNVASAQTTVNGTVFDSETKLPIEGVHISVPGKTTGTISDAKGKFSIEIINNPEQLYFSHLSYIIEGVTVDVSKSAKVRIYLTPSKIEIKAAIIRGARIEKISNGDTLNVVDYQIYKNKLIIIGNPYKQINNPTIYLANLNGDLISQRWISQTGRMIKFPEIMSPKLVHSFKDCFGEINLLTKKKVWQIVIENDSIYCLYPTEYKELLRHLLPIKATLNGSHLYQISDWNNNHSFITKFGQEENTKIKSVYDPSGHKRYEKPLHKNFYKYVSAPVFVYKNEFVIFDFFDGEICFYNNEGSLVRKVPIDFQNKEFTEAIFFKFIDLDQKNFKQQIYFDPVAEKFYAYYNMRVSGRQSLREIDIETGKIAHIIEIPEYPNVSRISIYNNTLYFIYTSKTQPFYQSLYKMKID